MLVEIMRPEADMPLGEPGAFMGPYPSGAPAIFIDTAAKMGTKAGMVGCVGSDAFGRCLTERFLRDGVDSRFVKTSDSAATAVAFVSYQWDGSRSFIFHMGNTPAVEAVCPPEAELGPIDAFHVMGCSLTASPAFRDEILKMVELADRKGALISFDPNIRPELLKGQDFMAFAEPVMRHCRVLMPGVDELLLLTGKTDVREAVDAVLNNGVTEIVALKRGKRGCTIHTRERSFGLGVYSVIPRDPTGAGDSFDAAFLCALLDGRPLEECARIATAAASINTAAFGPMEGDVTMDNIREMMAAEELDVYEL